MPTPMKNGKPPVLKFSNYCNIVNVPIVECADFEVLLVPASSCQPNPVHTVICTSSTRIYVNVDNNKIPASKTTCFQNEVGMFVGEDATSNYMAKMVRIGNVVKGNNSQSKPMCALTTGERTGYVLATTCCHCSGPFTLENWKVHGHNQFISNYNRVA
ncbi:hypothetical protein PR048_031728 [Dryococelus australis]|uniref:Uncharacterized protein n=1 Tax=Dryococelus australis TaxID=614101 RepID=A0ABQ9G629_9NEOP|nr:hypothetical protein PR048_031728 [Dryococelus australis]